MANLKFRDPGPFDEFGDLRDELSALRVDLEDVNAQLARRESEVQELENRLPDSVNGDDNALAPEQALPENRSVARRQPRDVIWATTHGIVPSLDMISLDQARRVVGRTTHVEGVVAYKFGFAASLPRGLATAVAALAEVTDHPLIYDHQSAGLNDAHIGGSFSRICADAGVDGVVLFPAAGPDAVSEFVINAYKNGLLPLIGGGPSESGDPAYFAEDALFRVIDRCVALSADHFVVPASDLAKLKRAAEWLTGRLSSPALFVTGIEEAGETIQTVFAAAGGCRAYAVIGRGVCDAEDPTEAAKRLAAQALDFI